MSLAGAMYVSTEHMAFCQQLVCAGSEASSSQAGHSNPTAHQHPSHSVLASPNKHPKVVREVLAALAKPVKGTLGNGSHSKQKADHLV